METTLIMNKTPILTVLTTITIGLVPSTYPKLNLTSQQWSLKVLSPQYNLEVEKGQIMHYVMDENQICRFLQRRLPDQINQHSCYACICHRKGKNLRNKPIILIQYNNHLPKIYILRTKLLRSEVGRGQIDIVNLDRRQVLTTCIAKSKHFLLNYSYVDAYKSRLSG